MNDKEIVRERIDKYIKRLSDVKAGRKVVVKTKSIREKNQYITRTVDTPHSRAIDRIIKDNNAREGRFKKVLKKNVYALLRNQEPDGDYAWDEINHAFFYSRNFVPDAYRIDVDLKNKSMVVHVWEVEYGHRLPFNKMHQYFWIIDRISDEILCPEGSEKDLIENFYLHVVGCKENDRMDYEFDFSVLNQRQFLEFVSRNYPGRSALE